MIFTLAFFCFCSSESYSQTNRNTEKFILSAEEQLWVSSHPVVRVTNQMDWAPIDFVQGGEATGFSIDYINLVLQNVGLSAEYINGYSWDELHKQTEEKKIDIIHSLIETEQRDKYFLFSKPYLNISLGYFAKKGSTRIRSPSDLIGKTVGVISSSGTETTYKMNYPNIRVVEYSNILEALIALSSGTIDLYVGRIPVVNYTINKNFMADLELVGDVILPASTPANQVRLAIRNDLPILLSILEKGMAAVTDDEYNLIVNKWQAQSTQNQIVSLTEEEKDWLKKNNTIRVSAVPNLTPLEFITEEGKISGITGSYLDKISEILGVRFIWAGNQSWPEGYEMIKTQDADIISAASMTPERSRYLNFSDPYLSLTNMILSKNRNSTYTTMDDLKGKTIAQVKGFAVTAFIKQDYPEINVIEVETIRDALILIEKNKVEAFIGSILVASPIMAEEGIDDIVTVGESPYKIEETIGIRSDLTLLTSAIDKAINAISAMEKTAINHQWMSRKPQPKLNYTPIIAIAGFLIFITIIILIWNTGLRREVNRRIIIEKELKKSQKEAEQANTAKSAFLANMSHEIRTPLNAIIGFSEFINSGIYGEIKQPKYKEYLSDIINSSRHLATVIDDILDLSKIEAGKLQLLEKEFDLNDCIVDALKMVQPIANSKNILLSYRRTSAICLGDNNALKRVIINLLSNAIKYTNSGGKVNCLLCILSDGTVKIGISDTGIGIPADRIEQVKNPFEQIENSFDINEEGTGLGLSIVQKLTELHGGNFTLESELGVGTVATIILPKSRVIIRKFEHRLTS
ncbi:MAG: transporter substrate-binding domain-containing protein [Emcibacteraceae bacterium]